RALAHARAAGDQAERDVVVADLLDQLRERRDDRELRSAERIRVHRAATRLCAGSVATTRSSTASNTAQVSAAPAPYPARIRAQNWAEAKEPRALAMRRASRLLRCGALSSTRARTASVRNEASAASVGDTDAARAQTDAKAGTASKARNRVC